MKITRLQQLVFASVLVAVPSMASAPLSLCGDAKGSDEKADNDSKAGKSDDQSQADKKADKKDSKDKKASKGSV